MRKARCGSWRWLCSSGFPGPVIPGWPKGPDPQSIATALSARIVFMGSGFAAVRRPGMTTRILSRRELLAAVALDIKQGREIAVIDARPRARGDLGPCPIGDAEPGSLKHRKVVRAVADREGLRARELELFAKF